MVNYRKSMKSTAAKKVKGRYYNKGRGKFKTQTIIKDAIKAYNMLNAEKKYISNEVTALQVAQVDGNGNGWRQYDVTPLPPLGDSVNQMNGSSLKITTSLFQFQVSGQPSCISRNKLIVDIYKVNGTPQSVITSNSGLPMTEIYEPTIFSGVIDANSTRFQNNFSDYTLIRSMKVNLDAEQQSGEIATKTFMMPIKYNRGKGHHVRYANPRTGGTADIDNGQIVMLLRTEVGNHSGSVVSTLPIPITAITTGLIVRWSVKHWYYDN